MFATSRDEGEHIAAGQPICTVFAAGSDEGSCHAGLVERPNASTAN